MDSGSLISVPGTVGNALQTTATAAERLFEIIAFAFNIAKILLINLHGFTSFCFCLDPQPYYFGGNEFLLFIFFSFPKKEIHYPIVSRNYLTL